MTNPNRKPGVKVPPKESVPSPYAQPAPEERQRLVSTLIQKVQAVAKDFASYDTDEIPATSDAIERTKNTLLAAAQLVKIPMGGVAPFEGGIQITWRFEDRFIRAFWSADDSGRSHIYRAWLRDRKRQKSELCDLDGFALAKAIQWVEQ